jgi:hypothetical protein
MSSSSGARTRSPAPQGWLNALRPNVLRECGRRDQDAQELHKRREAELVDYIRAERVKDTPHSEIRERILQYKAPFSPDNVRYVDQLIRKVQVEEQKKLEDFKRELGIKPVIRKRPGRCGMERPTRHYQDRTWAGPTPPL